MHPAHVAVRGAAFSIRQRDSTFVVNEVLNISEHYKKLGAADCNEELIESIISNCSSFAMEKLYPIDATGDKEGCKLTKDGVVTPKGFKEAYAEYMAGGWQSMSVPPAYGGQGAHGVMLAAPYFLFSILPRTFLMAVLFAYSCPTPHS